LTTEDAAFIEQDTLNPPFFPLFQRGIERDFSVFSMFSAKYPFNQFNPWLIIGGYI